MLNIQKRIQYPLKRLAGFLRIFLGNSKGIAGLVIVIIFAIMAVGAPLFTPYHPILTANLAGDRAAPTWFRYLPKMLGGNPDLAENVIVVNDPYFGSPTSLQEWAYPETPHVSIQYEPNKGYPNPGSLLISFKRNETGTTYGNTVLQISKEFDYPYTSAPRILQGTLAFFANGTGTQRQITEEYVDPADPYKWPLPTRTVTITEFDTQVNIKVFIERVGVKKWNIWPVPIAVAKGGFTGYDVPGGSPDGTLFKYTGKWFSTRTSLPLDSGDAAVGFQFRQSYGGAELIPTVFSKENIPGKYRWSIEITFMDKNKDKTVETNLYIDDFSLRLAGNSWGILGTDMFGRDLWSQLVHGVALSLYVGLLSAVLSVVIGLAIGLMAGYLGKAVDEILMRFTDMLLVIPSLPLLIVLVAVLGPKLENLIILLGILGWMSFARLVRSQVLSLKERPFVEAAKAVGAGKIHILTRHILPNVMSLTYVSLAISVPSAIVSEAALSWLGFWDPMRMSWGRMLSDVFNAGAWEMWWWTIPPGLCIAFSAMAFILLGYALDEVLNPKLRIRR